MLVLKSHELPCLRFYSSTLSKVIINQPLNVATTVAVGGITEGNEMENNTDGHEGTGVENKVKSCRGENIMMG